MDVPYYGYLVCEAYKTYICMNVHNLYVEVHNGLSLKAEFIFCRRHFFKEHFSLEQGIVENEFWYMSQVISVWASTITGKQSACDSKPVQSCPSNGLYFLSGPSFLMQHTLLFDWDPPVDGVWLWEFHPGMCVCLVELLHLKVFEYPFMIVISFSVGCWSWQTVKDTGRGTHCGSLESHLREEVYE